MLIIAGLDPSGGAGLIADIRVCEQLGCRPVAVATALTLVFLPALYVAWFRILEDDASPVPAAPDVPASVAFAQPAT